MREIERKIDRAFIRMKRTSLVNQALLQIIRVTFLLLMIFLAAGLATVPTFLFLGVFPRFFLTTSDHRGRTALGVRPKVLGVRPTTLADLTVVRGVFVIKVGRAATAVAGVLSMMASFGVLASVTDLAVLTAGVMPGVLARMASMGVLATFAAALLAFGDFVEAFGVFAAGVAAFGVFAGVSPFLVFAGVAALGVFSGVGAFGVIAGVTAFGVFAGVAAFGLFAGVAAFGDFAGVAAFGVFAGVAALGVFAGVATF